MKQVDEKVHPAASVVTFAIGPRPMLLEQPSELREANIAAIPDPARRAARRSVIEHGVAAPEFGGALRRFVDLLDAMEAALQPGGWLSGDDFGLGDAAVLPYVVRLDHLAMTPLLSGEARPLVSDWYARARARASFETAVASWAPEPVLELFRKNGEAVWPAVEPLVRSE